MTLTILSQALPFPFDRFGPDITIQHLTPDPEQCRPHTLFLAIHGFQRDGHTALAQAIAGGATAFVIDNAHPEAASFLRERGLPFLTVSDSRIAEAHLTSRFWGDPHQSLHLTAVTGTNGKTSVTAMLEAIYTRAGYKAKTIGTLSGKLTTPDPAELYPLLRRFSDEGITHVFMEASSHALALGKLDPLTYDCGIFTNLTPEHLDFHHDMASYGAAKAKLFAKCRRAVLNADDPAMPRMAASATGHVITVSARQSAADFFAVNLVKNGSCGITYDLCTADAIFRIRSPIPGDFAVMNTMQAAVAAYTDGIPRDIIRGALGGFRGVKGRLESIELPTNDFAVYIDYAHTPDALDNILRTVRGFMSPSQRLVLLFGCGGDRDRTKRPLMGRIASQRADYVILTADNSRSERTADILNDILQGIEDSCSHTVIENRREAITYAITSAKEKDVILLCGKGHEEYEIMPDGIHPFSERAIVLEAAEKRLKSKGLY